jgi:hypothetical protein
MIVPSKVRLLDLDPELGTSLDAPTLKLARPRLVVSTRRIADPEWRPDRTDPAPGHLGLLLVAGIMLREMTIGQGRGVELLAAGDLLRPAQEDSASFATARWRILRPIELAILDERLAAALGHYPPLLDALLARVMWRSRSQAALAAIQSVRRLDDRLVTLFWHLAERHGTFSGEGVRIPLPLTHQILADLLGARRPSVSVALKRLDAERRLWRRGEDWLLCRELPIQLAGGGAVSEGRLTTRPAPRGASPPDVTPG